MVKIIRELKTAMVLLARGNGQLFAVEKFQLQIDPRPRNQIINILTIKWQRKKKQLMNLKGMSYKCRIMHHIVV